MNVRHDTAATRAFAGIGPPLALFLTAIVMFLGVIPRASAETIIDIDSAFSGTINADEVINLVAPGGSINGAVTNNGQLWFNNPDIDPQTVSSPISGSGLVVLWQPVTVTFSGTNTYAGGTVLYDGVTTIASGGSIYHPSANLDIDGVLGTLLNINGSMTNADAHVGYTAGSFGDVNVNAGASWTSLGTLYAGYSGTSTITITGGTTSASSAYFGYNTASSGSMTLSAGTLQTSGGMYFGYFGNSSFQISGGNVSSAGDLYVSYGPGSATGSITSGTLSAANTLTVGKNGIGSLLIDGGHVSAGTGVFGQSANGDGTVTILSGTLAATNALEIGSTSGGEGTLNVSGGTVTSASGFIGNLGGSRGTVNVSAGSWTLTGTNPDGNLQVGYLGTGLLDISGGSVSAIGGNIGWGSTGSGTVSMSGGSLSITNELDIGRFGNGTLLLSSGTLSTGQVILGLGNHLGVVGSGTANVTGGRWINSLSLTVGQFGNGVMTVSDGYVTAASGYIGSANTLATTGLGSLTVTGGTVAFAGNLNVGNDYPGSTGAGTLTVSGSSGLVTVNDTLFRASNGTVNLNPGGTLSIGTGGATGTLATSILNNGLLIFNRSSNSTYGLVISGSGAVKKRGLGTLTIAGTNTYSGATDVEAGTMVLNGALGETHMTVFSGATLSGSGSSLGDVSIASGGLITPGGDSIASLTMRGLDLSGSNALSSIQITGSSIGLYDQILAQSGSGSTMSWGNGTVQISMTTTTAYDIGTVFHLFQGFASYTGNLSQIVLDAVGTDFAGLTFADANNDGMWQTGWNAKNQSLVFSTVDGTLIVVPEPSTLLLGGAGLAAIGVLRYRRRKRAAHGKPKGEDKAAECRQRASA